MSHQESFSGAAINQSPCRLPQKSRFLSIGQRFDSMQHSQSFPPSADRSYWSISGDPTEGALLVLAGKGNYSVSVQRETYPLLKRFPFESIRKRMSSIHYLPGGIRRAFVKGSPKEMLSLSTRIMINQQVVPINENHRKEIARVIDSMARDGLRVLALAYRDIEDGTDLNKITNEDVERDLTLIGITAMYDPPDRRSKELFHFAEKPVSGWL